MSLPPAYRVLCLAMLAWSASAVVAATTQAKLDVKRDGASILLPGVSKTVVCWGHGFEGETIPPSGLKGVVAVAAGVSHSLALKQDGTVIAWGDNRYGQTSVPKGLAGVVAIATRSNHNLALKQDGTVVAWGKIEGDIGKSTETVPSGLNGVVSIAAGVSHSLALKSDGTLVAWGYSVHQTTVPKDLNDVVAIAAGDYHSTALRRNGTVVAWGDDFYGQTSVPSNLRNVAAISAGMENLALSQGGSAVSWSRSKVFPEVASDAVAVASDYYCNLILKQDGMVFTRSYFAQDSAKPPDDVKEIVALGVGRAHAVAIRGTTTSVDSGSVLVGHQQTTTVTLLSSGVHDASAMKASVIGPSAREFSVEGLPASGRLAVGAQIDITLRFTPAAYGPKRAALLLTSNGADVVIPLRGIGLEPELEVVAPEVVENGGALGLGVGSIGLSPVTRTITLRNIGNSAMQSLAVSLLGTDAADFRITGMTSTSLVPNGAIPLTLTFTPTTPGAKVATLRVVSNDRDENPFDIVLTAQGTSAQLYSGPNTALGPMPIINGTRKADLGSLATGTFTERTFTVRNTGPTALTGMRMTFVGADRERFTTTGFPASLAPGSSTTFTVRFTALLGGSGRITLARLLFDQSTEMPIELTFVAQVRAPKLAVVDVYQAYAPSSTSPAVVTWGSNYDGESNVPNGLTGVVAISAFARQTLALREDGTVVAWGKIMDGLGYVNATVPTDLFGVLAISAGATHSVALKWDGTVVAWGSNSDGQTNVPSGLSGVVAVAAGGAHTVALKRDGSVVAWGRNYSGQTIVPQGLSGVVAIAAGWNHTVVLKQDGTVVAWGANDYGQTEVPQGLKDVVALAASWRNSVAVMQAGTVVTWGAHYPAPRDLSDVATVATGLYHTLALRKDGAVTAWLDYYDSGQATVPDELHGVQAIAAGDYYSVAIGTALPTLVSVSPIGTASSGTLTLNNLGDLPLDLAGVVLEGPDADQFSLPRNLPSLIAAGGKVTLTIGCSSLRSGKLRTRLHIFSTDPETPEYVVTLLGTATYQEEANPVWLGGPFTYAPLRLDRQTGLILQRVIFTNPTGVPLHGLKLILSNVAAGVQIYSSSVGAVSGTYAVIYSKPIAVGETISFDLVSFDPKRRTSASVQPSIKAEALLEPEPDALPVSGFEVPLLSVRQTPQGPMLEWNSTARATYVVEYSDDAGKSWFSAVHRLSTSGTRQFWIDRGQPETRTKPVGVPNKPGGRQYRLKKF